MCGFYCIDFTEYMISGKTLLKQTNFLIPMTINRMTRQYTSTLKATMKKEKRSFELG